jgi:hypothetical protein
MNSGLRSAAPALENITISVGDVTELSARVDFLTGRCGAPRRRRRHYRSLLVERKDRQACGFRRDPFFSPLAFRLRFGEAFRHRALKRLALVG